LFVVGDQFAHSGADRIHGRVLGAQRGGQRDDIIEDCAGASPRIGGDDSFLDNLRRGEFNDAGGDLGSPDIDSEDPGGTHFASLTFW
jgi:hypothetical protein